MRQNPTVIDMLHKVLKYDHQPMVRTNAALALALLNDTSWIPDLVDVFLNTKNDFTHSFMALSLVYMGEPDIVTRHQADLDNEKLDDLTRMHCFHVTAKILAGKTSIYLEKLAADSNLVGEYPQSTGS